MDRKTVVDALERCARLQDAPMSGECADCAYRESFGTCGSLSKLMMGAAELLKKSPTVGGWVSVKDRLPEGDGKIYEGVLEESNPVLVYGKDEDGELTFGVSSYVYDHSEQNDSGWDGVAYPDWDCESCTITHWMPLPEPPKGVNTDAAD